MSEVKKNSLVIIAKHFGRRISALYEANFEDKDETVVLAMMKELLTDYLGADQAEKEMLEINNPSN